VRGMAFKALRAEGEYLIEYMSYVSISLTG